MELKQLTERVTNFLEVENINEMSKKIFDFSIKNDSAFYENFLRLFDISSEDLVQTSEVLSEDFMQKIFQYYLADRKEKMQDYTPISLAKLVGPLAGEECNIIDMCAGSGALTIQKWNLDHEKKFLLYEFD
jgi:type I restriction enzyme M protein